MGCPGEVQGLLSCLLQLVRGSANSLACDREQAAKGGGNLSRTEVTALAVGEVVSFVILTPSELAHTGSAQVCCPEDMQGLHSCVRVKASSPSLIT